MTTSLCPVTFQNGKMLSINVRGNKIIKIFLLRRHVIAILGFFNFCNLYLLRLNLSITIVAMTSSLHPVTLSNGTTIYEPEFKWDTVDRGKVLSSFFYGYVTTQILGGWLGTKFGGVKVFGIGIAISSILTLFTPLVDRTGLNALIILRIMIGVFEGAAFPCMTCIWAHWAPPLELTRLVTATICGSTFGNMFGMPLCGLLADKFGWSSTYYATGVITLSWSCVWMTFAKDKPDHDPRITQEELTYIKESIGPTPEKVHFPVKDIIKSLPVYATISTGFFECWGYFTVMTQMPVYLNDVFKFDVKEVGILTSFPYVASTIMSPLSGYIADLLRQKNILTTTQARKYFTCTAFVSQFLCMVATAFSTSPTASVFLLTIGSGVGCFAYTTIDVNFLDLAPQHAGLLSGISNMFNTIAGMLSPILSGFIVINKSMVEWRTVFLITGIMYLCGAIFYGLFGSGEKQPWTEMASDKRSTEKMSPLSEK